MSNFLSRSVDVLGSVRDGIQRHVLGADSTAIAPKPPAPVGEPFYKNPDIQMAGAALAGGGVGAYIWKQHRILGFVAGSAAGAAVPRLVKRDWKGASEVLIPDAAAIGGSLLFKKHPVIGFLGGLVIGSIAEPHITKRVPA